MMDQSLSFDQIRQLMALQAATQPQTTTAATAAFLPTLQDQNAFQEFLLQQQLHQQQQQQLAAFAAATTQSHSAFRRPHSQQAAAFPPVTTTQPSPALLPFMVPTTTTTAATSSDLLTQYMFSMIQPQPQQTLPAQQQQNLLLHQLMMMQQAQQLLAVQTQQQPEPMQLSNSAAPTTASSPQLSTSPVVRKRARTYAHDSSSYARPRPKAAPKPKQEHSVLRSLCEASDDEDNSNRPNSAPNGSAKKRAVDPESPDRHHPKNLAPSNDDARRMETQVAMFLMSGGACAMNMDSVLAEGLTSDDSPQKGGTDSGYTSRSASNGGNSAPAIMECDSMTEDIQVIYEKFKDDQNVPRLEALVFPTSRSLASSPNGHCEMRDRISSVSLPRPVFDKLVDNVLNTCLA